MKFDATLLSESYPNGRCSGTLEIIREHLCFLDEDEKVTGLPLNGIDIRLGGSGNRYIYFTHPSHHDICIYTDDKNILRSDDFKNNPYLSKAGASIIRKRNGIRVWLIIIALLFVGSIASLFIFRGAIVHKIADALPPENEQRISEEMKKSALVGKDVLKDTAIQAHLMRIVGPLVNSVDDKRFKFDFTIVKDNTLNAFALPGGSVVIHSGLIEKTKTAEELAGVLAHEISHVTKRHHVRGIIGNVGIWLVLQGMVGHVTNISATITTAGTALSSLKYSRDFEREADDAGFGLLKKSNVNPQGMIDFFGTMQKESGKAGEAADEFSFLTTHPGIGERIERLKKLQKENPSKGAYQLDKDYSSFRDSVKKYFK